MSTSLLPRTIADLDALPAPHRTPGVRTAVREALAREDTRIAVIDDDPTGTQAMRDLPLVATWDDDALAWAMDAAAPAFAVLTNTRAVAEGRAQAINRELGVGLARTARRLGVGLRVISRGDSTLRGHFPQEPEALAEGLAEEGVGTDMVLVCPAFPQAGRITVHGTHLVRSGDQLTPIGETEFARDAAFGFRASSLAGWVRERAGGDAAVVHLDLEAMRRGGTMWIAQRLLGLRGTARYVTADAVDEADLEALALGVALAERDGARIVCRTGPSFVAARAGRRTAPPLTDDELAGPPGRGLVVVGSHTALTTAQLGRARRDHDLGVVTLDVEQLLDRDPDVAAGQTRALAGALRAALGAGDAALVTSRRPAHRAGGAGSLADSRRVADALVDVVAAIATDTPLSWLVAKGGITSSDMAVRALGSRRAVVRGQLFPGQISVWELGAGCRCPDLRYVVFPGNVGDEPALSATLHRLKGTA